MRPFARYDGLDKIAPSKSPARSTSPSYEAAQAGRLHGYYLIESGNGVISSVGLFETAEQTDASAELAASWIRDEKLETAFPNPPTITKQRC